MSEPNSAAARLLRVRGLVQGVGFRWSSVEAAQRLGLFGWVRNRRDGSVEMLVCGSEQALAAMIHWAQSGPPTARVDRVEVEDVSDTVSIPADFRQLPSA